MSEGKRIREAEDAAPPASAQWEQTFDSIHDAICLLDEKGAVVRCNQAMAELMNRVPGRLCGRTLEGVVAEGLGVGDVPRLAELQGARQMREWQVGDRWFRFSSERVSDPRAAKATTVVVITDITAQKQAEAEIRKLNKDLETRVADFQTLLNVIPFGIAVAEDPDCKQVTFNPAFSRVLRIPPGANASPTAQANALVRFQCKGKEIASEELPMEKAARGQLVTGMEFDIVFPDGIVKTIFGAAAPLHDSAGNVRGSVGGFMDMSERMQTERLLQMNEKLAATGRLAASIAHEINNPMASVMNLLYLLDCTAGLSPEAREYVDMARQEVARMSHIVKQMLGFYRESAAPVPVRLGEIVDSVLDLHGASIRSHNIQIIKNVDFDGEIQAFPGELRQVFVNLVSNAVEAMGKGGILKIRIAAARDWRRPEQRGVRAVVADNGPGISLKHRAQIFEPFFTTKGIRGTGLGLWVTEGIIRKHGGYIRVRSSTRKGASGTCFVVFLPSGEARPDACAHPISTAC